MGLDMMLYRIPMVPTREAIMAGGGGAPATWAPPAQLDLDDEGAYREMFGEYHFGHPLPNGGWQDGHYEKVTQAAYWRKSNQIHDWFVRNVQGGEDDCGYYHVSIAQLRELLATVKRVLETVDENGVVDDRLAEGLLPTQGGFFFGGTDYDDWYVDDLRETVTMLEAELSPGVMSEFDYHYYHASW